MLHKHDFSSACGVRLHSRRHLGKGVYYMRVVCKGLQVGDEWESWTHRGTLTCTEIISVGDSRGVYKTERKTHPSFLRGWDVSDKH